MHASVGGEYGQRYRPTIRSEIAGNGGPLVELKRLLSSRSSSDVCKATSFVVKLIQRSSEGSSEWEQIIKYLLDGDICVFLCDAMASLDWNIVRGTVECLLLMAGSRKLVAEEHSAYVVACAVRLCSQHAPADTHHALQCCLRLIADIFISVHNHELTSVISNSSIYNSEQLLDLLSTLADRCSNAKISLSTSLVLHSFLNYQPEDLHVSVKCAEGLASVLEKWLPLLCGSMADVGSAVSDDVELFYGIVCQLGVDTLRLCRFMENRKLQGSFVQRIITNEEDTVNFKKHTERIVKSVYLSALELVSHTKNNWENINNNDYGLFLQFLKLFLTDPVNAAVLPSFSERLATSGYLSLLPKNRLIRNVRQVDALSMSSLGEILANLCRQYLGPDSVPLQPGQYTLYMNNLQRELSELPHDADAGEWPRSVGAQLCTDKPYALLTYLYFHCLTTANPQVVSASLLPHLVEHIVSLPSSSQPPDYIVKCLWLVFAMARISNTCASGLQQRVRTEQATRRLMQLLSARPGHYYTHHPSVLLCSFISHTITHHVKRFTLTLWMEREGSLPEEITSQPIVTNLLLEIMRTSDNRDVTLNAAAILRRCLDHQTDETLAQEFAQTLWAALPDALAAILQKYDCKQGVNLKCLVDLATDNRPGAVDRALHQKLALLISVVLAKMYRRGADDDVLDLSYCCLKLAYSVLTAANKQLDYKALAVFVNGAGFLQTALAAANDTHAELACTALQLLSYIVHAFATSDCRCDVELRIEPNAIATILHKEMNNAKGAAFLQLLCAIMSNASCDRKIPINLGAGSSQAIASNAMRALLLRLQMICCKESREKSAIGWKTLNAMMKYTIDYGRDGDAIQKLVTQPWMFTLVRFQLSQRILPEFLTFVRRWLCCLKIILQNTEFRPNKVGNLQHSLISKTVMSLREALARYDSGGNQRPTIVDAILETVDYFIPFDEDSVS